MAQEASGSVADTVTVDGKGQVDPSVTKQGAEHINALVAEVEDRSFVSDLGPLPALNPAPSPRQEVVEGPALDAGGVKARSLVIVEEGAY